jgi:GNAT superfamily N-acetyltransferase
MAAKEPYIQPNPITRAYWLVFDIDSGESRYWPDEWRVPPPNIEARNPENNHQHLFYMIDPAVYTLRQARTKPLELAADVDRGLTRLLNADPGYGKLISKNPLSPKWNVYVWHGRAWGLLELLEFIPERLKKGKPGRRDVAGLGRNCAVFEDTRFFAYAEWRRLGFGDEERLLEAVFSHAMNLNLSFHIPMIDKEVHCIARSITKWTSRHMTAEGLTEWHRKQNRKSVRARRAKAAERATDIKVFYEANPDATRREIAAVFGVSEKTVQRLKVMRGG